MSTTLNAQKIPTAPDSLATGIKWSLLAHLAAIVALLLKSLVFPGTATPFVPTLRVDIVGLPDILKKDLGRIPRAPSQDMVEALKKAEVEAKKAKEEMKDLPEPKETKSKAPVEKADPDEMVLKPKNVAGTSQARAKKLKGALARIKSLEKISMTESSYSGTGPLIKGNRISRGTSLSGDAREAAEASYYEILRDHLQANWALPIWLSRQSLSAQVIIYIDSRGRLHSFKFTKPSGNQQFDDTIKKTINESQPFPAPPEALGGSLLSDGILVGFPL